METLKFGPNDVTVDNDLVASVSNGTPTLEDAQQFLDAVAEVEARHGQVVMLTDVSKGFAMSPEIRRLTVDWSKKHRLVASALWGATTTTRAVLTLVTRAMN